MIKIQTFLFIPRIRRFRSKVCWAGLFWSRRQPAVGLRSSGRRRPIFLNFYPTIVFKFTRIFFSFSLFLLFYSFRICFLILFSLLRQSATFPITASAHCTEAMSAGRPEIIFCFEAALFVHRPLGFSQLSGALDDLRQNAKCRAGSKIRAWGPPKRRLNTRSISNGIGRRVGTPGRYPEKSGGPQSSVCALCLFVFLLFFFLRQSELPRRQQFGRSGRSITEKMQCFMRDFSKERSLNVVATIHRCVAAVQRLYSFLYRARFAKYASACMCTYHASRV